MKKNQNLAQFNFLDEIEKTISKNRITSNFDNLNTSYGPPTTVNYDGSWSIGNHDDPAQEDAAKFAKKITKQTVNRITRQVHEVRSFSHLDEREETIVHSFDNQDCAENIRGVYRWVNKVYSAHVVNDGHRLVIEFMIDTPATEYIQKKLKLQGISLQRPQSLKEKGVLSPQDITRQNYIQLASSYNLNDIEPPLPESKLVSVVLESKEAINKRELQIPNGYQAINATVSYISLGDNNSKLIGLIGKNVFSVSASLHSSNLENSSSVENISEDSKGESSDNIQVGSQSFTMNREDSTVPIVIIGEQSDSLFLLDPPIVIDDYLVTIEIQCDLALDEFQKWQARTYNSLCLHYQKALESYYRQSEMQASGSGLENPLLTHRITRSELKKCCIKQLLKQYFKHSGPLNMTENTDSSFVFSENQPRYIQFFETAFEWDEMTSHFYPDLGENISLELLNSTIIDQDIDSTFTNFLQASLAKILVPVRPEYTSIVLYYLSSGLMWSAHNTLVPVNSQDVPLINELKKLTDVHDEKPSHEQSISEPWEITIPTSMLIIQDNDSLPHFYKPEK